MCADIDACKAEGTAISARRLAALYPISYPISYLPVPVKHPCAGPMPLGRARELTRTAHCALCTVHCALRTAHCARAQTLAVHRRAQRSMFIYRSVGVLLRQGLHRSNVGYWALRPIFFLG
eukprot:5965143-Pleurochrysis_carterae.AAC.1